MVDALLGQAPSATGEETLDPRDWERFRATSHRMLDDMIDYLASARERAAWQPIPACIAARFRGEPVPRAPQPLEQVYEQFKTDILPYPFGNIHPRFWGWVVGTGTPVGMMGELLAAAMNPNVSGHAQAAKLVEQQVIRWMATLLGLPPAASGLLVSGASEANLLGLAVARNARAGFDVRCSGLQVPHPRLTVYASDQTHGWITKACELLGLGREALRLITVADDYTIRLDELRKAVVADRAAGYRPCCVVGTAGTVNTGATDDLVALAELAREQDLWFHVDGAFGALAALAPDLAPLVAGLERADSVAFDLHKWGFVQYEAGVVLVRDEDTHRQAFAGAQAYLHNAGRGTADEPRYFADLGVQLSRGFRALKIWLSLKTQGADAWGRLIRQNVAQAQHLARRVAATPELELLAPVPLNVVCFRYRGSGLPPERLDALNEEILLALQERGIAVPSSTRIHRRLAIRVANVNHRTRQADFDALVGAVLQLGRELARRRDL